MCIECVLHNQSRVNGGFLIREIIQQTLIYPLFRMLNEILIADIQEFTTLNQAHSWRADFDIPAFEVERSCVAAGDAVEFISLMLFILLSSCSLPVWSSSHPLKIKPCKGHNCLQTVLHQPYKVSALHIICFFVSKRLRAQVFSIMFKLIL